MRPRITQRRALVWLVVTYIIVVLVVSPVGFFSHYQEINEPLLHLHRAYCMERWPSRLYRILYSAFTFLTHFAIPLGMISVLYIRIFRRLQSRLTQRRRKTRPLQKSKPTSSLAARMMKNAAARGNSIINKQELTEDSPNSSPPPLSSPTSSKGSSSAYKNGRTAKMLAAVVLVFAVFWTPYHIFVLLSEINYSWFKGRYFKFTNVMLRGFAMSSACVNPFLYGWFNEVYRTSFFAMISRFIALFRPKPQGINDLNVNTFTILSATMTRFVKQNTYSH